MTTIYKHDKTEGLYIIVCEAKREIDQVPMIVYRKLGTNEKWIRPASEFFDGRFTKENI